jgi:hypothetical protein
LEHHKKLNRNVFDERAIYAFINGLCRQYFMEELGCANPKKISTLMDIANKFAKEKTLPTASTHAHPNVTALSGIAAKDKDPTTMMDTMGPIK